MNGATAVDDVLALAVRADDAATVDLDFSPLPDEPELNCIPEEAAQFLKNIGVGGGGADAAVTLQEVGEDFVRVHGHVAEDIVKDIGLGRVFERVAAAQPSRGGKEPIREHLKKRRRRQETADRSGTPAGARAETRGDGGEVGQAIA